MTTSDLVVVGALDGAGRSVLWSTPGAGPDLGAVRQAAVLPTGRRFVVEPGWLLRRLPSGRWLLLTGGTQHPDLLDAFGRRGVFSGAGILADAGTMGALLRSRDATAMCLEAASMRLARSPQEPSGIRAALGHAKRDGALRVKRLPERARDVPLPDASWRAVSDWFDGAMRPFTAPLDGPSVLPGQPSLDAGGSGHAASMDGAIEAARRVVTAWREATGRAP